ncbi:MAG: hypothetical protein WCS35_01530 [Sphaerochaeta sp.]
MPQERLTALVDVLKLSKAEEAEMYDIAGQQKGLFASDFNPYVNNRPYVNAALRTVRNIEATEDVWQRFVDDLIKRKAKQKIS